MGQDSHRIGINLKLPPNDTFTIPFRSECGYQFVINCRLCIWKRLYQICSRRGNSYFLVTFYCNNCFFLNPWRFQIFFRPRIQVDFSELKADVKYPASIDCESMAITAIYVKYDHLSDTCPHYDPYPCPPQYEMGRISKTFQLNEILIAFFQIQI